jgi:hypothetical protein
MRDHSAKVLRWSDENRLVRCAATVVEKHHYVPTVFVHPSAVSS